MKKVTRLLETMKQDVALADNSGTAVVTLCMRRKCWFIKRKAEQNFFVSVYQSSNYLAMGGSGTEITPVDDIEEVAVPSDINEEEEKFCTIQLLLEFHILTRTKHVYNVRPEWSQ